MTPTAASTSTCLDAFLRNVSGDHRVSPWADDAVLDAVVPGWRFALEGAHEVGQQFRVWFAHPGTLEEVRRLSTGSVEVVEFTVAWVEDGTPFAVRQVHVLDIDEQGRIARDHMWCGGRWPADLLAQMGASSHAH